MGDLRPFSAFGRWPMLPAGRDPFAAVEDEMNRLVERLGQGLTAPFVRGKDGFLMPKVDVAENDAGLEITAELPGFDEKDVAIDMADNILTIRAEHTQEHKAENTAKDDKTHYHVVERVSGAFLRRFALPFEADAAKASAKMEKGLLKVTIPRLAAAKAKPTMIPIGGSK
jgi:HSP20 family protein